MFVLKSKGPYDVSLRKINLLTVKQRRFVADVTFLSKALNGHIDVEFSQFLDFIARRTITY